MRIQSNKTFKNLLKEYDINLDKVDAELPTQLQKILSDKIISNEFGVALKNTGAGEARQPDGNIYLNNSQTEDGENHFHVDWLAGDDEILAFKFGVKTLIELSHKFIKEGLTGIRFWYSFQSPKMAKLFTMENNINDDETNISDRLSFYTLRKDEFVFELEEKDTSHFGLMWIDI